MTHFMPHGACYLWEPGLIWLHAISDGVIAASYFAIPIALLYVVHRRREDLPFHWLFLLFALFIVACGATHLLAIWTIWRPDYWLSGGVKAVTAVASLGTAILLVPMLPRVIALKSPYELERLNEELQRRGRRLAEAQRTARLGNWEWDVAEDRISLSEVGLEIFGFGVGEEPGFDDLLARIHPEDREGFRARIDAALESAEGYQHDYRVARPDGSVRIVYSRARIQRDEADRPARLFGTLQDVTERRRLEEERRESERRFQAIFDQTFGVIAVMDPAGTVIEVNEGPLGGTGEGVEAILGEPFWEAGWWAWSEAERSRTRESVEAAATGRTIREEREYRTTDGEIRIVDRSIKPVLGESGGEVRYLIAEGRDITDLKAAQRSLRMLAEAGRLFGASLEFEATLHRVADLVVADGFATACFFDLVLEDGGIERPAWASSPAAPRAGVRDLARLVPSLERSGHPVVRAIREGDAQRISRVDEAAPEGMDLDDRERELVRSLGLHSWISVPVAAGDRVLGALTCVRAGDGRSPFAESDLELAAELGRRAGAALDNARLYERLRESEEGYRLLTDHASDTIIRFSPTGLCTYASPAARTMLGYDPESLVDRHGAEFIHPEDLEKVAEKHRALLHGAEAQSVVCRLRHADGSWVWAETTSQAVREPGTGWVESIVTVSRDVSENVEAARTVRLLERVAAVANRAETTTGAMRDALRLVCEHTGWPIGHAHVPRASGAAEGPTDIWHLEDPAAFPRFRERTAALAMASPGGLPGRVMEMGRPAWVEDVADHPDYPALQAGEDLGVHSAFAFPVVAGDDTLAVLEFFSAESRKPDERLLDAMRHVGSHLGQVVRRQQAEAALRGSEGKFRALAESAHDAILIVDEVGEVIYGNGATVRIFGRDPASLVGESITALFQEEALETFEAERRMLSATGPGQPVELAGRRADGAEVPLEISLGGWEAGGGSFVTVIVRDITPRKEAERALEEKMEELARSNSELALFTYVASHDLREPLRTVGSNVQLIARGIGEDADPDLARSIDFALAGVRRMQDLIDDLLVYSRVGTEGKPFEPVSLDAVLDQALENLRVAIEESGGRVEREPLPRVLGDETQLVQLTQNLIANALKFRREDEPPEVRVSARPLDGSWEISVADNGIGIDPRYADHVFTIFQRLNKRERYEGTGIGLAICRKIVERHGGRIRVEPGSGGGSVFRLTLPAVRD